MLVLFRCFCCCSSCCSLGIVHLGVWLETGHLNPTSKSVTSFPTDLTYNSHSHTHTQTFPMLMRKLKNLPSIGSAIFHNSFHFITSSVVKLISLNLFQIYRVTCYIKETILFGMKLCLTIRISAFRHFHLLSKLFMSGKTQTEFLNTYGQEIFKTKV